MYAGCKLYAIGAFRDGYCRVTRNDNKWNFINSSFDSLLTEEWFQFCREFKNGFAAIQRGDGFWNYIDVDGNTVSPIWFDEVKDFNEYYFCVKRECWGYLDEDGVFKGKYDEAGNFIHDHAHVVCDKKHYYINVNFEKILGPFSYACDLFMGGFGITDGKVIDVKKEAMDLCMSSLSEQSKEKSDKCCDDMR